MSKSGQVLPWVRIFAPIRRRNSTIEEILVKEERRKATTEKETIIECLTPLYLTPNAFRINSYSDVNTTGFKEIRFKVKTNSSSLFTNFVTSTSALWTNVSIEISLVLFYLSFHLTFACKREEIHEKIEISKQWADHAKSLSFFNERNWNSKRSLYVERSSSRSERKRERMIERRSKSYCVDVRSSTASSLQREPEVLTAFIFLDPEKSCRANREKFAMQIRLDSRVPRFRD